ncbi:MAG: zinc-ribbon domain-containing protein [Planctomycetota bacterium]
MDDDPEDEYDREFYDELDDDPDDDPDDECFPCPECGAEVLADAEACPACGYWITDADRTAAWRAGSASGRIVTIGLWALVVAVFSMLALQLL